MAYLNFVFKGAHSNHLYTAYFDGSRWHGNTRISTQPGHLSPSSSANPGSCLYHDRLYLVYKGARTSELFIAYHDGQQWRGDVEVSSMPGGIHPTTDSHPSVVEFNHRLYVVYKGEGSQALHTAWFDGTQWAGGQAIGAQPGGLQLETEGGVDAVTFRDRLYVVYKAAGSHDLCSAWFDGESWRGGQPIRRQPGQVPAVSDANPSTVVFRGRLCIFYKAPHTHVLHAASFDGSSWQGHERIKDQPGGIAPESSCSPGVQVFDNQLYLVYKGAHSDTLYSARFDGETWSGNTPIREQPGGIDPECGFNPDLNFLPIAPGSLNAWLADLPDTRPVGEINLPGTHASAAINHAMTTPYACHHTTLTQQFDAGARLLDIRLKVLQAGTHYGFVTCHGDIGPNEYQSFDSVLQECEDFLKSSPSEFIAMSLKIDDWNGATDRDAVCPALAHTLASRRVHARSAMPTLGEVRGHIWLLNRINDELALGVPIDWPDNTAGAWAPDHPNRAFPLYVQDHHKGLPVFGASAAKLEIFTAAMGKAGEGALLLNFANATSLGLFGVSIMGGLLGQLGRKPASARPHRLGWPVFDYESNRYQTDAYGFMNAMQIVVASNFAYRGCEDAFKVV